jgi:hypothetical protein
MIKIIRTKRLKELLLREKLFLNEKLDNPTYQELIELYKKKQEELNGIARRIKGAQKTYDTLVKSNGRNLKEYKRRSKKG